MITIYDVAKKAGFSSTTVSKALNNYSDVSEKTKQQILRVAAEMGYLPNAHAQSLSTKKSWTIGVMFSEANEVGMKHPFFNGVIESFRKYVEREGYDLIFASRNLRNRDISYLEHFQYRAVDGIVVICSDSKDAQVREMINSTLPITVIDRMDPGCSVIHSDNVAGSSLAVHYLYSLGHTKIAHIAGDSKTDAGAARIRGYKDAMKQLHLPIPEEYLINGGLFSIKEGKHAMEQLLSLRDRPTAVFAAGDHMAIGAIEAVKEKGLSVPEDISIIGFDDIEMSSYITPKLTTIKQDTHLIGERAAKMLLNQITKKKKMIHSEVIPVELIIRDSCRTISKKEK
ncbi:LacI family DNA-binding transcriptional regulator [Metabacillus iocasae]|uniref:LacI family transcriptional regulator n=1 Tax=Priestia iocasae TaxID=2291674 RepID=A0ABS2R0K8_9BACI|nr:LacI family DNA-binding transcriptional regulator [Metabacillus iocasae]MBM7704536.1 LacI family transcriptional regulator [Metabacillus iocasae]